MRGAKRGARLLCTSIPSLWLAFYLSFMPREKLVHSGVLFKKGAGGGVFGRRNWKLRHFVLTTTRLQYYTKPNGRLKGEISLSGCEQFKIELMPAESMRWQHTAVSKWRLALITPERRLLLSACTEGEMKAWAQKLALAFWNYQREYPTPPPAVSISRRKKTKQKTRKTSVWIYNTFNDGGDNETELMDASDVVEIVDTIHSGGRSANYFVIDDLSTTYASYYEKDTTTDEITPLGSKLFAQSRRLGASYAFTSSSSSSSAYFSQQPSLWELEPEDPSASTFARSFFGHSSTSRRAARTLIHSQDEK